MAERRLTAAVAAAALAAACQAPPELSESTYEDVVRAFHTGVAALDTSQDAAARGELERVTELAPMEPAGWADLGVLEMRRGNLDAAQTLLEKARELAPESAAIERLLAICSSQQGRLEEAVSHWQRALALDPANLEAAFSVARETERLGGPEADAEAQRALEALVARTDNLAARLELARLAAKRGDQEALARAVEPFEGRSSSWPSEAKEQLEALTASLSEGPEAAVPHVMFLRNVLLRSPQFRRDLEEVTGESALLGAPLERFVVLDNPEPRPAPADEELAFSVRAPEGLPPGEAAWVGAIFLGGEEAPAVAMIGGETLRLSTGASLPFPGVPAGQSVAAGDLDYDFRTDLVLAGSRGLAIFRQTENGGFTEAAASTDLAGRWNEPLFGAWPADIDIDGDLDVVLAPEDGEAVELRNNGDGTFEERRPFAGLARLRGFLWADLDGEGVPDAAALDGEGRVRLFVNLRGGQLEERTLGTSLPTVAALALAEASGDAILDVLALTTEGAIERISYDPADERFDRTEIARTSATGAGARLLVADLDNNGAIDLIVSGESGSQVLLGGADGELTPVPAAELAASAAADLNGDGRLELVGIGPDGAPSVAESQGRHGYHWLVLHPRATSATGDQRMNPFGIGGEIEARSGLHFQKMPIEAPAVHFGLGESTRADVVRIGWPNGVLQSEFELTADQTVLATQRLKGSCPWLFTWNGNEMQFVTDLLWRSPLGLRINAQETAGVLMTEDRVKVRGDQLVPREGQYDLRITSELWETQFFDTVSLLVVDHPEGTEAFVDERFAVPPPDLRVRVTGPVLEPAAVWDDAGRDVTDVVRARDGRHLDFAGRGQYQGITRDHDITVELPEEAPREGPLWLVGQGWVHPTDSSINLASSQGDHPRPRGLALFVDDGTGRFELVRDDLGFPAGKDKTVLLDLTGVFPEKGPRRLRLTTNLEVFWDRLGFAAGRPDVEPELRRLTPSVAELRYRGYDVADQPDASSPERPRYELAGTAPRWRDLEGYHTRFGDVRELLLDVDDRYVIMNAGDEIRLRFPAAPPPAPGLARDFVVESDGWVKDGDFNTTFSRTVLPLPTHDRASYDDPPGRLEDDPVYRKHPRDFEIYHTRYVTPERLRRALEPERR